MSDMVVLGLSLGPHKRDIQQFSDGSNIEFEEEGGFIDIFCV